MAIIFEKSKLNNVTGETWRMVTSFGGDASPMTSWEKADNTGAVGPYNNDAALLSESAGIFSFAETGCYILMPWFMYYGTQHTRYHYMHVDLSWNNGSNWDTHGYIYGCFPDANNGYSGNHESTACGNFHISIPSVSGASARKIRFRMNTQNSNCYTYGNTNHTYTGFSIFKISSASDTA